MIHAVAAHLTVWALSAAELVAGAKKTPTPEPELTKAPNPDPKLPPGFHGPMDTILAWAKGIAIVGGVIGLIWCGALMAIGSVTNKSMTASDGASNIPKVMAGIVIVASAPFIVDALI